MKNKNIYRQASGLKYHTKAKCHTKFMVSNVTQKVNIQNGERNNYDRHEINKTFGSFQLQYCNHRQPMKI